MATERRKKRTRGNIDISTLAVEIFDEVRDIKKNNRAVARNIDALEREIRDNLDAIRRQVNKIRDKHSRDLVTILVINGLHRTAEEVLVD